MIIPALEPWGGAATVSVGVLGRMHPCNRTFEISLMLIGVDLGKA